MVLLLEIRAPELKLHLRATISPAFPRTSGRIRPVPFSILPAGARGTDARVLVVSTPKNICLAQCKNRLFSGNWLKIRGAVAEMPIQPVRKTERAGKAYAPPTRSATCQQTATTYAP